MGRWMLVTVAVVSFVVLSGASGSAVLRQSGWRISDLGVLSGSECQALAVNDRGQVVGVSETRSGAHVFLWEKGRMTDLGTLGGAFSGEYMWGGGSPVSLNEHGQVAGSSETSVGNWHAFLWQRGKMRDLGTLGGGDSRAVALNERGQVVGSSDAATPLATVVRHAFLWTKGRMRDLGTLPGGDASWAAAINDKGQIVGTSNTGEVKHGIDIVRAFLWQKGKMRDLGTLRSGWRSSATAINERGQIIGVSVGPHGAEHGFVWQNGKMIALPGVPTAINNRGQIVGTTGSGGTAHAFLWEKGNMRDLGTLGGRHSNAVAINERGQIVGTSSTDLTGSGVGSAFVWQDGRMIDIGILDADPTRHPPAYGAPTAINTHGLIVGTATSASSQFRAVLWTPKQG